MSRRPPAERDHLSVQELSDEGNGSRALLYREIQEGKLPHLRVAGRIVVSRKAFIEYARRAAADHTGVDLEAEA